VSGSKIMEMNDSWMVRPILQTKSYLIDELRYFLLTQRGMKALKSFSDIFEGQVDRIGDLGESRKHFQFFIDRFKIEASMADDVINQDYSIPRQHHCISLWTAIETCVEEVVVSHLKNIPEANVMLSGSLKGFTIKEASIYNNEANCRRSYKDIEKHLSRKNNLNIVEKYETVLRIFNMYPEIKLEHANGIVALHCIRNLLLHKGGLVDDVFKRKMNKVGFKVSSNKKYVINSETHDIIFRSCAAFYDLILQKALNNAASAMGGSIET